MLVDIDENLIDDILNISNKKPNKETDEGKKEVKLLIKDILIEWVLRKEYMKG
jgi:hypothetical protein